MTLGGVYFSLCQIGGFMIKTCNVCGHSGEPFESGGGYYCATCGSELQVTDADLNASRRPTTSTSSTSTSPSYGGTSYEACPFCESTSGHKVKGAIITCGSCGKKFKSKGGSTYSAPSSTQSTSSYSSYDDTNTYNSSLGNTGSTRPATTNNNAQKLKEKREKLEKEKSSSLGLAILFLFLFWPVAIFFFIKWYNADKELKELDD